MNNIRFMKQRLRFLPATIILFLLPLNSFAQDSIYSEDFGMGLDRDATPAAVRMMNAAKEEGISTIIIRAGTYHFYPDKAFEKYCFISNHDDGLRRTPFPVINFDGLEIIGKDAHFIFHGVILPFILEDSKNITLSGFSIDWELPLASEALVVKSNPEENWFDIKISEDQPYEIRDGELIFLKEGYEHNIDRAIYWDPKTTAIAYGTDFFAPRSTRNTPSIIRNLDKIDYLYEQNPRLPTHLYRGFSNSVQAEELEQGVVRISFKEGKAPREGLVLVCKGLNGYNRWAPAIRVLGCEDIEIKGVSIYSAGGMGVIAEASKNIKLDGVRVEPSPGTDRMLSTSADATHFVNCRGKVQMLNSTFSNQLDDATNVHGIYLRVVDVIAGNKIGIQVGHFQQFGFEFGLPGDEMGFVDIENSNIPVLKRRLKSIDKINKKYFILEFEDAVKLDKEKTYWIENCSAHPELLVSNCRMINNRGRGLLISTPKETIIENNYFNTMMSALMITSDLVFWYESGTVANLIIRNNQFGDCCYGGRSNAPVIRIFTDSEGEESIFENITIENNQFNSFDAAVLSANRVKGLVFKGNQIACSGNYQPFHPDTPAIRIEDSKDVLIEKNIMDTEFKNAFSIDDATGETLVIRKNRGF
jgi:hypothetical protein